MPGDLWLLLQQFIDEGNGVGAALQFGQIAWGVATNVFRREINALLIRQFQHHSSVYR